jgi:hypothetical protein
MTDAVTGFGRRYARALAAASDWCRENRHKVIREQHAHLTAMMRGHYAYDIGRDQAAVGNGDTVGVAGKICQHLFGTGEWALDINEPVRGP